LNQEQALSTLRFFLTLVGGMLVSRGVLKADSVGALVSDIISVVSAAAVLGSYVWSLCVHTQTNAVAVVAAMPQVSGVVTMPTVEGAVLAASVPGPDVAAAGTPAATSIATK
jgi:hypothetical protein